MEEGDTATAATTTANNENINNKSDKKPIKGTVIKKHGPLHLIRVALYMLRRRSGKKSKPVLVDVATRGLWKTVIGAMRPLHLQHDQSAESFIPEGPNCPEVVVVEDYQEVLPPTLLPEVADSPSSSRYASAENLQELAAREGYNVDDDDEEWEDGGDEMIDARAEEFIANFYEQMRLQQSEL